MPITELIFFAPKQESSTLQRFAQTLPSILKTTFAGHAGLLNLYQAKVWKASNVSEGTELEKTEKVLVLEWDKLSSFEAFMASDSLGYLKSNVIPFLAKPSGPEVYSSADQFHSGGTTSEKFTHVVQVSGVQPADQAKVESAWQKLVSELTASKSFHAWGARSDTKGTFIGLTGWDDIETFNTADQRDSTRKELQKLASYGQTVSYVLELTKQSV